MPGTRFSLEVQPKIPERLGKLEQLANDLLYSWDRRVRGLFVRLDRDLWDSCGHNPKVFLRRIAQDRLEQAAKDRVYMEDYHRALSAYATYHRERTRAGTEPFIDPDADLIAYFCAEFGFHESLPIYSGGLGILAGDHCKAASDLAIPFVAVGLLYRQGYFTQRIDEHGNQISHYRPTDFADLPLAPVTTDDGTELRVHVDMPGRTVGLRVWHGKAGHITLYLLDSDLPDNSEADRSITYQLYGGDINTRIQQEIVLGIGGQRALRALGLNPTVWHINEGHAAFLVAERCRECVDRGMDFDSALEQIAAGTVFTTHTPVAAGHDIFDADLMKTYFGEFVKALGTPIEHFLELGSTPTNHGSFNMTALALRGSRFHNGVSRIHGEVSSRMEAYVWPQIQPEENPIGYVTNGVHVPTFLAREWVNLFDMRFGGEWRNELLNNEYWNCIDDIPDHSFWSLRHSLKAELLEDARRRAIRQYRRNGCSEAQIERLVRYLTPEEPTTLTLGFARRFATYKRATLLFTDPERLARLLNRPGEPVVLLFAGKAHPNDLPGQHLIQVIHEFSRRPEFEGRIVLLEDYDMAMARKLVTGVDVWVNTPEYPLEASGTSGEKAGINGVINLSVLDGWWGEGYNGENGWAIAPHGPQFDPAFRNKAEAQDLLDLLESEVIPLYYERIEQGYPEAWVSKSKASMKSLIPRFNAQRMVMDYVRDYYGPAIRRRRAMADNGGAGATELARWKTKVREYWGRVSMRRLDDARPQIHTGETLPLRVAAKLNGLDGGDVIVECLIGVVDDDGVWRVQARQPLAATGNNEKDEVVFALDLQTNIPGLQFYKIRMYPYHDLLAHPFETGLMIWL